MNWIEFNHFCQFVGDCGFGTLPLPDRCLQVADPVALNWTAKGFGKRMFSERAARNVASLSRVENRRSGFSLPVAADEAFASSPQSGLAWLCFLFPLIEPDRRISRIRLSEKGKVHGFAHGKLLVRVVSSTRPST
jgi:hypothetical protein